MKWRAMVGGRGRKRREKKERKKTQRTKSAIDEIQKSHQTSI